MKMPSVIPDSVASSKSHYDDFTAVHINASYNVHNSGSFLTWHREFIHLFEQSLRQQCNYSGGLPYWNWTRYVNDIHTNPMFSGSDTSFGGDGAYNASNPGLVVPATNVPLGKGTGGGCITTGPFANITAPFIVSPNQTYFLTTNSTLPSDALTYRPHCLRRDLNQATNANNFSPEEHAYLTTTSRNITDLQNVLNGATRNPNAQHLGQHAGGHYGVGGDLSDFFASPSDPVFYLHHAMLDATYTQWQAEDPARLTALAGTETFMDVPASPEVTLDYVQDLFWWIGRPRRTRELISVRDGGCCYEYV